MAGFSAHDDGDIYGTPHFLKTTVWYAEFDAESKDTNPETASDNNSDNDEPYQLHLLDGDIDGIEDMTDIIRSRVGNVQHLT